MKKTATLCFLCALLAALLCACQAPSNTPSPSSESPLQGLGQDIQNITAGIGDKITGLTQDIAQKAPEVLQNLKSDIESKANQLLAELESKKNDPAVQQTYEQTRQKIASLQTEAKDLIERLPQMSLQAFENARARLQEINEQLHQALAQS